MDYRMGYDGEMGMESRVNEPLLDGYRQKSIVSEVPKLSQFKKEKHKPNNSTIFKLTAEELELFFNKDNTKEPNNKGECRGTLNILAACGYNKGLCEALASDSLAGIVGDQPDLERRVRHFGQNQIALPSIESFSTMLYRQFEEDTAQFLTWAATIYLFFSFFSTDEDHNGFIESLTIYFGLMFASLLAATCDYIKEGQLLTLKDEINNQTATVARGQYGQATSVPLKELVVGDVLLLHAGDRIPADCIILDEQNLIVDQSIYSKRQQLLVEKRESHLTLDEYGNKISDNHKANPDNILLSNTKVMNGEARAIVCAVGNHTLLSRSRRKEQLVKDEEQTVLEAKLQKVSNSVGNLAQLAMGACFLTQVIYCIFFVLFSEDDIISNYTLMRIGRISIIAICILIVAIPEGLPLAVSIAMALSITKMKNDNIMIKNVESVQKCAILHDICVSKTGTLTEGDLHVASYQLTNEGIVHENDIIDHPDFFNNELEATTDMKDLIKETIAMNNDSRIEIGQDEDDSYRYIPKGQPIEVGMIDFLIENNEDVQGFFVKRNYNCEKLMQFPFSPDLKRKSVIRNHFTKHDRVRVYVKGAPEEIIPLCNYTFSQDGKTPTEFHIDNRDAVLTTISDQIAARGQKPLSYAIKDMDKDELAMLMNKYKKPVRTKAATTDQEDEEYEQEEQNREKQYRAEFESDLSYLGTFGLQDELRPEINVPINLIKYGHTENAASESEKKDIQRNVRMISGDHIECCKTIAVKVGILKPNETKLDGIVMSGPEFREAIGDYQIYEDKDGRKNVYFSQLDQFKKVKQRLKIIARATPEDKMVFVRGIQQHGGLIGICGDSITDAEVLKQADVGLCMGSGCDVAKDNSDLVILDNNFNSIRRSILWGRAMFQNVQKFLQFQLTINFSLVLIVFISGITLGTVPFNVIQLLWLNLIMDILAAISLGTEPITESNNVSVKNKQERISRADRIITTSMWRNIVIQSLYQIIIVLLLLYFGTFIFFDEPYNLITTTLRKDGVPTPKMTMNTIIFFTYFLMNMVNQINCRVVNEVFRNPFHTLFNNGIFWFVLIFEMAVTHLFLFFGTSDLGTKVLGVTKISLLQYCICWVLALLSMPLYMLTQKKELSDKFKDLQTKFDLENENSVGASTLDAAKSFVAKSVIIDPQDDEPGSPNRRNNMEHTDNQDEDQEM